MTGFDSKWEKHSKCVSKQKIVMIVHFRPDKKPKNKAEWYEMLGNYAHTLAKIIG